MNQKYSIFPPKQNTEFKGLSNYLLKAHRAILATLSLSAFLMFLACSPLKKSLGSLDSNPIFKDSFTGFVLSDPENNQILFEHLGSKYFTPASNTKLFTFYVANRILGDSIPAFVYQMEGDSIWLWGTGDPSFLNPDLPASGVYDFLKGKHISLMRDQFTEPDYGPGWAWDDYNGSYQRPKSPFPIYANALHLSWDSLVNQPVISPHFLADSISFGANQTERKIDANEFYIDHNWEKADTIEIPFYPSEALFSRLWEDTLASSVSWSDFQEPADIDTLYSIPTDSVFKRMLQISDNFLAEQLILLCSWKLFGELNSERTIDSLSNSLLQDLPQPPIWVDGSGLSRYNLFTPLSIAALLNRIYREVGEERIFDLFPAGGQSGTIEDYYASVPPYIYAKTGTLNNNHSLSGYLIAKSGKRLIFSFMHNHYTSSSHIIKKEMEKMLWQVHLRY